MASESAFDERRLASIHKIAVIGFRKATESLSAVTSRPFSMHVPQLGATPFKEIPLLLGGLERPVVGVLMRIAGDLDGHLAYLLPWESAQRIWKVVLGRAPGSIPEMDLLAESAILEIGNIINSSFLDALADATNLRVHAQPPAVAAEMAGAVMGAIEGEAESLHPLALSMQTVIFEPEQETTCYFLCIPTPASLQLLMERLDIQEAA